MSIIRTVNNLRLRLAVNISSSDTVLSVQNNGGNLVPTLGAGQYIYATLSDANNNLENIRVTARTATNLTAIRGQDGTAARAYLAGDNIDFRINAGIFDDLQTTAAPDTNTTQLATTAFVVGQAGAAVPLVNGSAAVGTSLRYSRQDHVHPTDASRAPLASPTFTGQASVPAGSAAAPSLRVGAEQNGLFSPAANQLGIAVGGVSQLNFTTAEARFNGGLNVGSLSFSPLAGQLVVRTALNRLFYVREWDSSLSLSALNDTGAAWTDLALHSSEIHLRPQGGNAHVHGRLFLPAGTAAAPSLRVGAEQNGLFSPAANQLGIAVGGVSQLNFTTAEARFNGGLNVGSLSFSPLAGQLVVRTALNRLFYVREWDSALSLGALNDTNSAWTELALHSSEIHLRPQGGNAHVHGRLFLPAGTAAAPSLRVGAEQNGLFSPGANQLGVAVGGVSQLTFTTTEARFTGGLTVGAPSFTPSAGQLIVRPALNRVLLVREFDNALSINALNDTAAAWTDLGLRGSNVNLHPHGGSVQVHGIFIIHGSARTATHNQAFSATPTFDANLSNAFEMGALTGAVTSMTISNPANGQTISIRFIQDGTGGRTVAHPTGSRITGSMGPTANAASILTLTYSAASARWEGSWTNLPA